MKQNFYALLFLPIVITLFSNSSVSQENADYQVFALKYSAEGYFPAQNFIVGADSKDSVRGCNMFWLLKSKGGKNILVDSGYIDTSKTAEIYRLVRPDSILKRINIYPNDITDIIITHPHYDHIGGVNLFPKATVWMQKDDFHYFVGEAWQENGNSKALNKEDVRKIIEINLQGRLKLVDGDNVEFMPGIKAFIGSKHSYENMYLLVNSKSSKGRILIASDAIWFYYNYEHLLPANLAFDHKAYVENMKRIKSLVTDSDIIVPGHDDQIFTMFPKVAKGIVKIEN